MNFLKNKWTIGLLICLAFIWLGLATKNTWKPWFGGYTVTESGLKYKFIRGGKIKIPPAAGSYMLIHYTVISPDGDTLVNNNKTGDTLMEVRYPEVTTNPILEAISLISQGSTLEALILTDSLKSKFPKNEQIRNMKLGQYAKYIIHVENIISELEYEAYSNNKKLSRIKFEGAILDAYADNQDSQKWLLDTFEHYRYFVQGVGAGPLLAENDNVSFHMEVSSVTGNILIIHSRMENKLRKMKIGDAEPEIPALNYILKRMKPGQTGLFAITSRLGFGAQGRIGVPSYTPLLVKIYDLKKI